MPIEMSQGMVDLVAARMRAIGDPMRIRILGALSHGEATVGELTERLDTSQQNASHHLAVLHGEGIVARRRDGRRTVYSLCDPTVAAICDAVCASVENRISRLEELVKDGRG